ncbi:MAG: molybdenum cofactor guanylyltransferase [Ignavibacteriae bacterium]|nr:molybdenum cofactor guanylyltransferase [Ignavibacteriota bacterium]
MNKNFTAIILSGGKSSRMGTNKSHLEINGKTLIERTVQLCNSLFDETIIITNNENEYKNLNVKCYKDIYPNFGPLSGIHSGLVNSKTENNFIISCDMPFVNGEIIDFLIKYNSNKQIVLPKVKKDIYTMCGIYKNSCTHEAEKLLKIAIEENSKTKKVKVKLFDLINAVDADIIDVGSQSFYNEDLFFNMNSLDDYDYTKEKLSR